MAKQKKTKRNGSTHYIRVKKRKGSDSSIWMRRGLSILVLVLFLAMLIFGIFKGFTWIDTKLFKANPLFEIQHLDLSSDGSLSEDKIRKYAEVSEGMNLFSVNFEELERRLKECPVVEKVHIWRSLPHTLHIQITERIPMARISGLSELSYPFLVDRSGYILNPRLNTKSLPLIKGINQNLKSGKLINHRDVSIALKIIALCESSNYRRKYIKIQSLDVQYSDYIVMQLENRAHPNMPMRVRMPRYSIQPKLNKLAAVIKTSIARGDPPIKQVDLTVDSVNVPLTPYYKP